MGRLNKFFFVFFLLLFSYSSTNALEAKPTEAKDADKRFGIYGFYLGQTLSDAIKNAKDRGLPVLVQYYPITNSEMEDGNQKIEEIMNIVSSFKTNSTDKSYLEKLRNESDTEIYLSGNGRSDEYKCLFDLPYSVAGNNINKLSNGCTDICRDINYKYKSICLGYTFDLIVDGLIENTILHFISYPHNSTEPIIYSMHFYGRSFEDDPSLLDKVITTLNKRYGRYKQHDSKTNQLPAKEWKDGNDYAWLYRSTFPMLTFYDLNIYKNWLDRNKSAIDEMNKSSKKASDM